MLKLTDRGIEELRPTWRYRMWVWRYGWLEAAEGLVTILTLGLVRPLWTVRSITWSFKNHRKLWV